MSHAALATNDFSEDLAKSNSEHCKSIAISIEKHDPCSKEYFPLVIQEALRVGVKIDEIAKMAMTPVYNVKRWMNGTHCPPMLVRKTVINSVCEILKTS